MRREVCGRVLRWVLVLVPISSVCCGLLDVSPTVTSDESSVQTRVAQDVAATVAAMPTATQPMPTDSPVPPSPTGTPEVSPPTSTSVPLPTATPTPVPLPTVTPTPMPPPPNYVIEDEYLLGPYEVRLWRNTGDDSWGYDNIATISVDGEILVQVEMVSQLGELTGTDITGEGHPDVVIESYTGGAHCCFSTIVYDLGPTLTEVLHTPESNCSGGFEDLDGDSVLEFVTCDDLFSYAYCPYAGSPLVQVILQYEPDRGYVPASPRFAHLYAQTISTHAQMAVQSVPGEMGEWDHTNKCGVLPLMLDYLYTGQADRAWAEFNQLYGFPDRLVFWAEVMQVINLSTLYVAAGPQPEVSLPAYYMLQLLTNCGPDWHYVGLLGEGQSSCDPGVPHQDIYWLDARLREIGLLGAGEGLELTPPGCTTDCRLDVVRLSDGTRLGSIRIDTTVGFPGEVYRVNGVESGHWRLRGDLSWEHVFP